MERTHHSPPASSPASTDSTSPLSEVSSTHELQLYDPNVSAGQLLHDQNEARKAHLLERLAAIQIRLLELGAIMGDLLDELAFLEGGDLQRSDVRASPDVTRGVSTINFAGST